MAKGEDLVKYITEQVVTYIETPKSVRKAQRIERKTKRKEPWANHWFGMLPVAVSVWVHRRGKKRTPQE